jgi:hypothetical protein
VDPHRLGVAVKWLDSEPVLRSTGAVRLDVEGVCARAQVEEAP